MSGYLNREQLRRLEARGTKRKVRLAGIRALEIFTREPWKKPNGNGHHFDPESIPGGALNGAVVRHAPNGKTLRKLALKRNAILNAKAVTGREKKDRIVATDALKFESMNVYPSVGTTHNKLEQVQRSINKAQEKLKFLRETRKGIIQGLNRRTSWTLKNSGSVQTSSNTIIESLDSEIHSLEAKLGPLREQQTELGIQLKRSLEASPGIPPQDRGMQKRDMRAMAKSWRADRNEARTFRMAEKTMLVSDKRDEVLEPKSTWLGFKAAAKAGHVVRSAQKRAKRAEASAVRGAHLDQLEAEGRAEIRDLEVVALGIAQLERAEALAAIERNLDVEEAFAEAAHAKAASLGGQLLKPRR